MALAEDDAHEALEPHMALKPPVVDWATGTELLNTNIRSVDHRRGAIDSRLSPYHLFAPGHLLAHATCSPARHLFAPGDLFTPCNLVLASNFTIPSESH